MIINHNIAAMNTYRQLTTNNSNTAKSLEKLSSGLRINRAGDDAAGLAISEKMRAQIRGLDQASRNSQDAISLIQTAEGAMSETHSILQRMRELAVQASSDTNTTDDRDTIQQEINQLTSEINRIGKTTEFNTKKLLNGEASNSFIASGSNFGSGLTSKTIAGGTATLLAGSGALATGSYKVVVSKTTSGVSHASGGKLFSGGTNVVGTLADVTYTGTPGTNPTFSGNKINTTSGAVASGFLRNGTASGSIKIWKSGSQVVVSASNNSGVTINDAINASGGVYKYDNAGISFTITSTSGWASGAANAVSGHFAGSGSSLGTKQDYFTSATGSGAKLAADALGAGVDLASVASGLKAGHYKITFGVSGGSGFVHVEGSGASGQIVDNNFSGLSAAGTFDYDSFGMKFSVDFSEFSGTDGKATIEFDVEDQTKWSTNVDKFKAVVTDASGHAVASGAIGNSASYTSGSTAAGLGSAASVDLGGLHLAFGSGTAPTVGSGTFNVERTEESGEDKSLTFQIGANEHQSLNLSIGDVQSVALGISSSTGGSGFSSSKAVTDGTNADNVEFSLDVTTTASAAKAITTLDNAINKVSTERSKLGAVQNRLEHTINNLGTSSENLSAAESRIRDVDMAKTMMDFTKNNILTQAAQAMLAQANQQPQGVLQLLR